MEAKPDVNGGMDLTNDVLEQQGRNLRALARSLLRDAHAADDVVQESWLAYFAQPAGVPGRLSAWLGTVTRRLASRRMRVEGRRRAREEFAAAPEALEALHEIALEREEALRVVTQALLALDEPYKSTLILRYYDERSPNEIAKLQGLPVATVKSRLARGLERLGDKLGGAYGGDTHRRQRALALLAGVPLPELVIGGAAPAATAAATLIGAPTSAPIGAPMGAPGVLAALAGVCLTGLVLWSWFDESDTPLVRDGASIESHAATPSQVAAHLAAPAAFAARGASDEAAPVRRAVDVAAEPLTEPLELLANETQFPYRVSGVVRDQFDQPQPGASVFFAPRGIVMNRVATTDDEGRFAFEFDGRRPTLTGVFAAAAGETYLDLCEVRLVSGREFTVDVALDERANGVQADGSSSPDFARGTRPFDDAPEGLRLANGRVCFVDPPPQVGCARPLEGWHGGDITWLDSVITEQIAYEITFVPRDWVGSGLELTFDVSQLQFHTDDAVEEAPAPRPSLFGVARHQDGSPAAGVRVAWRAASDDCGDVVTGADGAFAFTELPTGEIALHIGGGDDGVARARMEFVEGACVEWNPLLDRGDVVTGRVVDASSREPLANARVELWSSAADTLWCDSTWTDGEGRFALPNVPAGALELHVRPASGTPAASAFPTTIVRPVFGRSDVGDVEVDTRPDGRAAIALTVVDASGAPVVDAHVLVWHLASGRGLCAADNAESDGYALGGLPPGQYRIEIAGSSGRCDVGTIALDVLGDPLLDLGEVRLPPIGAALVIIEPTVEQADVSEVALSLWSAHPDVFGLVASQGSRWRRAILPSHAGAYVVRTGDASGTSLCTPIDIPSGAAVGLTFEQSPSGALTPRQGAVDRELGPQANAPACASCHAPR